MYPKFYFSKVNYKDPIQGNINQKKVSELLSTAKAVLQNDASKAIDILYEADRLIPNSLSINYKLFNAYSAANNTQLAKEKLGQLLKINPSHAVSISHIPQFYNLTNQQKISYIKDVAKFLNNPLPATTAAMLHYGLAELYEELGDITREWNNLKLHNDLLYHVSNVKGYTFQRYLKNKSYILQQDYTGVKSDNSSVKPLFIVGMPRSGSTLVDQVLTSHDSIESLGESFNVENLLARARYFKYKLKDDKHAYNQAADEYLATLDSAYPNAKYVVDKMLVNYLNVGKIKKIFPRAKFIFCVRDPMPLGLSCFKERLGFVNDEWQFCNSLVDIGKYYTNIFVPVRDHWKTLYPSDIHIVCYEDLVKNFSKESKRLTEFLSVPFDSKMLDFHKNTRSVSTISRSQVRQPLYNKLDDWKKYKNFLTDLEKGINIKEEQRTCGTCDICCFETEINDVELTKPCNTTCVHLNTSLKTKKCKIYEHAPKQCKQYTCSWIDGYGNDADRPNNNGIIANITKLNDGTWTFVREVTKDALTTTGKTMVIDMVVKTNFPAIVKLYGSPNETGDYVIIKKELLTRASQIAGDLVKWLDHKNNIGLYELKIQDK